MDVSLQQMQHMMLKDQSVDNANGDTGCVLVANVQLDAPPIDILIPMENAPMLMTMEPHKRQLKKLDLETVVEAELNPIRSQCQGDQANAQGLPVALDSGVILHQGLCP